MGRKQQELIAKIKHYRFDQHDDHWKEILVMAERNMLSEDMCDILLSDLDEKIEQWKIRPILLTRQPEAEELHADGQPEITLGYLMTKPEVSFGHRFTDRSRNVIITGSAGSGKTVTQRNFIFKIHDYNQRHPDKRVTLVVLDLKGDNPDLREKLGKECLYFSAYDNMRIGVNGPAKVPPEIWVNFYCTVLAIRLGLIVSRTSLANIMQWLLAVLNPHAQPPLRWPSLSVILQIATRVLTCFSSKADYGKTLIQLLEGMIQDGGTLFDCANGFDLQRDVIDAKKNCIIDISNLPSYLRNFVVDILIGQIFVSRLYQHHKGEGADIAYFIDESDMLACARSEAAFPDSMGPLSLIGRQGRELQIMTVIGVSGPQYVAPHIMNGAGLIIVHNLSDAISLQGARQSLNLEPGGEQMILSLRPGQALIRETQGPWPHTFWGQIDYIPPARIQTLPQYDTHPWTPAQDLDDLPEMQAALQALSTEHQQTIRRQKRSVRVVLSETERKYLTLLYENPTMPDIRLFERMGKIHFKIQEKIRVELVERGLIQSAEIRIGRANVSLSEILDAGCDYLERPVIHISGRGGLGHRFMAHWIKRDSEQQGRQAILEYVVPCTGHPVDVAISAGKQWDLIEIALTSEDNLLSHIQTCFMDPAIVKSLTIITATKNEARQLEKKIRPMLTGQMDPTKLVFASIEATYRRLF